ncbi:MAG: protein translocase subunit SecF [Alphaproteobacteria bacterium]|nr:protein translocase subunit SecF [Alphaproteobacteria bacterium]
MAFRLRLVPTKTKIRFTRFRTLAVSISSMLNAAAIVLVFTVGLNFGVDFAGGLMIDVKTPKPADLGVMRTALGELNLGEVALQEFGASDNVLIRIEASATDEAAREKILIQVRDALNKAVGPGVVERRVEFVGPKVSGELIEGSAIALILAMIAIAVYVWFRFEWQFGIGGVIALLHDAITTIGLFAVTGMEFNLTTVAAVLTIIGFSINDTVVIYDRIRENMRKYKVMPIDELIDLSINETLSRTVMTVSTVVLTLLALLVFGGEVIRGFAIAMLWGAFVGTYSSIYVAAPILVYGGLKVRGREGADGDQAGAKPATP